LLVGQFDRATESRSARGLLIVLAQKFAGLWINEVKPGVVWGASSSSSVQCWTSKPVVGHLKMKGGMYLSECHERDRKPYGSVWCEG
jgi:hypothetical protein